jgi:hypothetical protein
VVKRIFSNSVKATKTYRWRIFQVIYYVASVAAGSIAAFLVIYASDDWFLVTLSMLVLLGLALAARSTLPKLYEQAKLLLNLGGTREGERLVYQGLPWLVRRMNIYCELVNPALSGGRIRVALRDLVNQNSRPFDQKEKWFPTDEGDWILLPDGTPAKVSQQTPEFVHVVFNGGGRRSFRTPDFLALNPRNLSANFRISFDFGLSYRHAVAVAAEIPVAMKNSLQQALEAFMPAEKIVRLIVEYKSAADSALIFLVQADIHGSLAEKFLETQRLLQRSALECAQAHGWEIPYRQLVVHQA